MIRKTTSVIAMAIMVVGLLPSMASAIDASGALTSARNILPGVGQTFAFSVTAPSGGGLFGIGGSTATANYVEAVLPPNLSNVACGTVPLPWTCRVRNDDVVILENGILPAGDTLEFDFTGDVSRPYDRDRRLGFDVNTSENFGQSMDDVAGDFAFTTHALAIVADSLDVVAPVGATDLTATAGQVVDVAYRVRSYAQAPVSVTSALASESGDFSAAGTVAAGGETTFTFAVPLRDIGSSLSDSETFTASVTGTGIAALEELELDTTIEHAQELSLDADSFNRPIVRTNQPLTYDFAIDANRDFLPGITNLTGTLSFAGTSTALENASLGRGQGSVRLTYAGTSVTAPANQSHDVLFTFDGTDDNGVAWHREYTLEDLISIDNLAPVVTVDLGGPAGQAQVKDGDTVTVTGTVDDGSPLDYVELVDLSGTTYSVDVSQDGTDFSGSVALATDVDYTTLTAQAQAKDVAGNTGFAISVDSLDVDNVLPFVVDPARVVPGSTAGTSDNVIEVQIQDNHDVAGGCNPLHWRVDQGFQVTEVRYSDGTGCETGSAGPGDNLRYLVVFGQGDLDPDNPYNVQYLSDSNALGLGNDRLVDGAVNEAVDALVSTVSGIAPALPDLVEITRAGGEETAVFAPDQPGDIYADGDAYWTRFPGSDAVATIRNTRGGYFIQVLDASGQVLVTQSADGDNAPVAIPIGSDQGSYDRSIRLINGAGLVGPALAIRINLDTLEPELLSSVADYTADPETGLNTVTVTFSEVLIGGANRSLDWLAHENNNVPGEDPLYNYRPDTVEGAGSTRVLNVALGGNGTYAGSSYAFDAASPADGTRYEDYAGNTVLDGMG